MNSLNQKVWRLQEDAPEITACLNVKGAEAIHEIMWWEGRCLLTADSSCWGKQAPLKQGQRTTDCENIDVSLMIHQQTYVFTDANTVKKWTQLMNTR